jgi:hypothetical protein
MYQLLRTISRHDLFARQVPALVIAFVVASLFYKWGSFALECLGFLATWFGIDLALSWVPAVGRTPTDARDRR